MTSGLEEFMQTVEALSKPRELQASDRSNRIATIDPAYTSGSPRIQFEDETELTLKTYKVICPGYTPHANDRVVLIPVGVSYVIVGVIT